MYFKIRLSPEYEINSDLNIRRVDGEQCDLSIKDGKVFINLIGSFRWYDLKWLYYIARYRVWLPDKLRTKLNNIAFIPVVNNSRLRFKDIIDDRIMVFTRPIYLDNEYRIVPCFTDYAVSIEGKVKSVKSLEEIKPFYDAAGYATVGLSIRIHRMVAHAWITNRNPDNNLIVNHINGIKDDNRKSNLEWVSFLGNSRHAVITGLKTDNLKCKVRDFETGEVTEYISVAVMCDSLGFKNRRTTHDFKYREPSNLWFGRYEVRVSGDERPWYYEGRNEVIRNGKYTVTVTHSDGRVEIVKHINDLIKRFKLWNLGKNVPGLVEVCRERFPDLKFELVGDNHIHSIQVLNVETKEVLEFPSIRECCRKLGLTFFPVQSRVRSGDCKIYQGYVFRIKSDKEWTIKEINNPRQKVRLTNQKNGVVKDIDSIRAAARFLRVDKNRISYALKSKSACRGWLIEKI